MLFALLSKYEIGYKSLNHILIPSKSRIYLSKKKEKGKREKEKRGMINPTENLRQNFKMKNFWGYINN